MESQLNYARFDHWVKRPQEDNLKYDVDVFFVYPTVYVHPDKKSHHLMPIANPIFRTAARVSTFWHDRFAARSCNVFAPFYRQVGMETLYMRHANFDKISKVPYHDVKNAFFYYLEHLNGGRPFILAGHSQGSDMLLKLLCRDLAKFDGQGRLIASYLIGYSVTRAELAQFPHLHMVEGDRDLGGIISYNTSAQGLKIMPVVRPGAVCVNPLNWRTDSTYAPKELNLGSILFEAGRFKIGKKHFTGAYVDEENGTLIIDKDALDALLHVHIGFLNLILMHRQSLHMLDIALFQENLARDVLVRQEEFFRLNPEYKRTAPK